MGELERVRAAAEVDAKKISQLQIEVESLRAGKSVEDPTELTQPAMEPWVMRVWIRFRKAICMEGLGPAQKTEAARAIIRIEQMVNRNTAELEKLGKESSHKLAAKK